MKYLRLGILVVCVVSAVASPIFLSFAQASSAWQIEVVDNSQGKDAGSFSSLAIDRFGNFHLAYSSLAGTALRYAFRAKNDKRWDKATIDASGGSFETLAVDANGWAHIAYNSPKLPGLHYAHWDGKQWQKFVIDPVKTGRDTSIQIDSHGNARISYYLDQYTERHSAKCLKYAYYDGKTWYVQTVDHRPGTGSWNSLALDRDDLPYISYSIAAGFLGFASMGPPKGDRPAWDLTLADFQGAKGKRNLNSDSSLVIGSDGEPRIAYINVTARTITYAWREGTVWHQETVDSVAATGADADHVCLALDKNGVPHVVYFDSGLGTLKYATRDKQGWYTETIDKGNAGQYASLCLGENDLPYVSYYATANKELRIAHRQSLEPTQKQ